MSDKEKIFTSAAELRAKLEQADMYLLAFWWWDHYLTAEQTEAARGRYHLKTIQLAKKSDDELMFIYACWRMSEDEDER